MIQNTSLNIGVHMHGSCDGFSQWPQVFYLTT